MEKVCLSNLFIKLYIDFYISTKQVCGNYLLEFYLQS